MYRFRVLGLGLGQPWQGAYLGVSIQPHLVNTVPVSAGLCGHM